MIIKTEQELESLGARLAQQYPKGGVILLKGELGAGKTTLVRGALRSLGHKSSVKSTTYTIVETYELPDRTIQHFDLYRLANGAELQAMGFRDYLADNNLIFIEWPEKALGFLPKADCEVHIKYHPQGRTVEINA